MSIPLHNEAESTRPPATINLMDDAAALSCAASSDQRSRPSTLNGLQNHNPLCNAETDERPLQYSRTSSTSAVTDTGRQHHHHRDRTAQNKPKDSVRLGKRLQEDVMCRSLVVPLIATSFVTGVSATVGLHRAKRAYSRGRRRPPERSCLHRARTRENVKREGGSEARHTSRGRRRAAEYQVLPTTDSRAA